ncbi:uncharacterized protein LOC127878115 isoform X2 [Dreissena polymorpha]|uniref:Mitochondria-eating protein n=1 Tax=Dreissena polymorpha TaxID=45954 RepID=A0A9D4K6T1_DREPO|nr:uncharacterized protein LOC127878115 isoform X2 [Dreissena polymorpha]KAH3834009.1 hypothetical protein DPMN_107327 [Dreissena polymorpha]
MDTPDQVPGRKKISTRLVPTPDQVQGRKESKFKAQMDEKENDRQIKALKDRVEVLENQLKSRSSSDADSVKCATLEKALYHSTQYIDRLTAELETVKKQSAQEMNRLRFALEIAKKESAQEIHRLKAALETAKLSKVVGEKPMKDNTNIADLSDKNRPTKLGELYTELYDNEWTDAYVALTQSEYNETEPIATLFETLKVCFEFCQSKADQVLESTVEAAANVLFQEVHEQMKETFSELESNVSRSVKDNRPGVGVANKLHFETLGLRHRWTHKLCIQKIYRPPSFEEELTRIRKQMSLALIQVVQKAFLKTYWDKYFIPAMKPFIKKCLFLCWMMVAQGPQMCFDWSTKHGSQFDTNLYRHYMSSGTVVEFVVWPAMYLHKKGPLIAKGVAQPVVKTA